MEYIKSFKWENQKFPNSRSLIEITGMITEKMKTIDSDLKKLMDDMNEKKTLYN